MRITRRLSMLSLLLLTFIDSASLRAQTPNSTSVSFGSVQFGGTGCPSSSIATAISPDGTSVSVLFNNFVVDASQANPTGRKDCSLSLPVNVPAGLKVTLVGVDYRGFNNLPLGATSDLAIEYFLAGGTTNPVTATFMGPLTENYLIQHTLKTSQATSTSCGGASILRVSTSLTVSTNANGDQASATIDSADLALNDPTRQAGTVIYLAYQDCAASGAYFLSANAVVLIASLAAALFA